MKNGPDVGEFGNVDKEQKLKNVVMDGVKTGKVGKLENCKIDDGDVESKRGEIVQVDHKKASRDAIVKDTR